MEAWTRKARDVPGMIREYENASANWHSLAPFFVSRGYHLYDFASLRQGAVPPAHPEHTPADIDGQDPYPYARTISSSNLSFPFIQSMRVWPARDSRGHEVILRLVGGPDESDEAEVYKRLNTPEARRDPRNHTLPVLEWLTHDGLVFVVMPRWDIVALARPMVFFRNVAEMLAVADTLFEGLEFLHEKRIVHGDIFECNIVMNVLVPIWDYYYNLRDPAAVRYAFIDYDASLIFPEDTDISKVVRPRITSAQNGYMGLKLGPCNPFKDDVRALAHVLERSIRHVEDKIPEIGEFFEPLVAEDESGIPTASQVLAELRALRVSLTPSQLSLPPTALFWYHNRLTLFSDQEDTWKALQRFKQEEVAASVSNSTAATDSASGVAQAEEPL